MILGTKLSFDWNQSDSDACFMYGNDNENGLAWSKKYTKLKDQRQFLSAVYCTTMVLIQ